MSTIAPHDENEQKTVSSYVVGFILSLIFTFTPYLLVVNHYISGRALLITILTFAMAQLLVQVIFFLHLGRGANARWNVYFFVGTFIAMLIVVVGSVVIISNLHNNATTLDQTRKIIDSEGIYQVSGELTGACQGRHTNHQIVIKAGKSSPILTIAAKCDTLTFVNKDAVDGQIMFGTRTKQTTYAGLDKLAVRKDHTKTISLSETGTFKFYDSLRPVVSGSFAVVDDK
ncbi:cytochrome o ubiquinol oxidase subunit IV [Polaromonas sp.]|nr:cytochrome o ubiquinol oxidase subunit IV [Candidatus Saccharibacteria bacterium]